jgi:hypothetical protein
LSFGGAHLTRFNGPSIPLEEQATDEQRDTMADTDNFDDLLSSGNNNSGMHIDSNPFADAISPAGTSPFSEASKMPSRDNQRSSHAGDAEQLPSDRLSEKLRDLKVQPHERDSFHGQEVAEPLSAAEESRDRSDSLASVALRGQVRLTFAGRFC